MLKNFLSGKTLKHPLHPLFVHFPVAFWFAALLFDIAARANASAQLAAFSFYCIAIGLAGAVVSALTGLIELGYIPNGSRPKKIAYTHMTLNLVAAGLSLANLVVRQEGGAIVVSNSALALSVLVVILLAVSGYLGSLLAYHYRIGTRTVERDATITRAESRKTEGPRKAA